MSIIVYDTLIHEIYEIHGLLRQKQLIFKFKNLIF